MGADQTSLDNGLAAPHTLSLCLSVRPSYAAPDQFTTKHRFQQLVGDALQLDRRNTLAEKDFSEDRQHLRQRRLAKMRGVGKKELHIPKMADLVRSPNDKVRGWWGVGGGAGGGGGGGGGVGGDDGDSAAWPRCGGWARRSSTSPGWQKTKLHNTSTNSKTTTTPQYAYFSECIDAFR